jgi:hypothetical protein
MATPTLPRNPLSGGTRPPGPPLGTGQAPGTLGQAPGTTRRAPGRSGPVRPDITSPRHTRPVADPGSPVSPESTRRTPRMAFIVLLVGLLGGALVSLLVISTTLAAGSFRIANLKQQNANLARQEQALTDEVAQESNPATIAREAQQLGMRQNPYLRFVNLKTGKIVTGKPSRAERTINVSGFTP